MAVTSVSVHLLVLRVLQVILTCISFSLVASVGSSTSSYWAWCMFCWCFCFVATILIIVLELTGLAARLPLSWDDLTAAFAVLASLLVLSASVIYPVVLFTCPNCSRQVGATVTSCLAFLVYSAEASARRATPGTVSGFLSTVPGQLKVVEAFVACVIFVSLDEGRVRAYGGLQWCVAVYAICFIFSLLVIVLTVLRLLATCPCPLEKALVGCSVVAVLMYATAVVVWPIYAFRNNPKPNGCHHCAWDNLVVVAVMTGINLINYIIDTAYSVRLVFFVTPS